MGQMTVQNVYVAGFREAIMGLGLSFGLTSEINIQDYLTHHDLFMRLQKRAGKLATMGSGHNKFLRQIQVWLLIDAPLYWWKQMDQYKVATVTQSESTMHTLTSRELTADDFQGIVRTEWIMVINDRIRAKDFMWLNAHLPQSFLQKRMWTGSYETLRNIIHQRREHKLPEWDAFIAACKVLPHSEEFLYAD